MHMMMMMMFFVQKLLCFFFHSVFVDQHCYVLRLFDIGKVNDCFERNDLHLSSFH